ncbi:hypothetical protein Hamer_G032103, partial [Homarus americanus]
MGHGSTLIILLELLTCAGAITSAQEGKQTVQVMRFNGDGARRSDTWLEYGDAPLVVTGDYTLCLRFNIQVFRLLTAIIYLLDTTDYDRFREYQFSVP